MMSERDADKLWDEMNAPGGPCGVCGVMQEDHPAFIDGYKDAEWTHDWEPPSDNAPDEPDED